MIVRSHRFLNGATNVASPITLKKVFGTQFTLGNIVALVADWMKLWPLNAMVEGLKLTSGLYDPQILLSLLRVNIRVSSLVQAVGLYTLDTISSSHISSI